MGAGQGGNEVLEQPLGGDGLDQLLADGEALEGALGASQPWAAPLQQVRVLTLIKVPLLEEYSMLEESLRFLELWGLLSRSLVLLGEF